jgi:hypothetical protein
MCHHKKTRSFRPVNYIFIPETLQYQGLEREFLAYQIMSNVGTHIVLAHAQGIRSVDE